MNLILRISLAIVTILIWNQQETAKKILQLESTESSTEYVDVTDPNYVDEMGNTNLILLAMDRNNHTSKMKELLENGADVNATNNRGRTAVYLEKLQMILI